MSDFAARLVARAQGRGALVAPRAPPRFAPEPGDSASVESPARWDGGAPVRAVDRPTAPQTIERPLDRSPDRPADDPPAATDAAVPEAAADGIRVAAPRPAAAPERPTRPAAATPPPVTPPPIQAEAASELSAVTAAPPARPVPPLIQTSEISAATAAPPPLQPASWPTPDTEPASMPAQTVAPAANDRAPRLAVPTHGPSPVPAPSAEPPPVVIEIGAVEFRTIQPAPPAAAPPARPAPSLTLDAYLAQRASRPGGR